MAMSRRGCWAAIRILALLLGLLLPASPGRAAGAGANPTDPRILHLLNRLAFGPTAADVRDVEAAGIDRWIDAQLHPQAIDEPVLLKMQLARLDTLGFDPVQLRQLFGPPRPILGLKPSLEELRMREQRAATVLRQAQESRLLKAILSRRQLQQVMVDFWFNHFNIFSGDGLDRIWLGNFEQQAIRPYALGHFRDLLMATAKHPAMLVYLDNYLSRKGAINENYAREVMELHTMGADQGYTQPDVITLARVLTGWSINPPDARDYPDLAAVFKGAQHDDGAKVFLGQQLLSTGRAEGEEALTMLARSPYTAQHISYELAQYFVADQPPPALVARLKARFLANDGDIAAVLKTLFDSPEFWASAGQKYKTPYQFVVSAARAAGLPLFNARPLINALDGFGEPLYGCQTPDGWRNTEEAWLSPAASLRRIAFATEIAHGALPLWAPLLDTGGAKPPARAVDPAALAQLLGPILSARTREVVAAAPAALRAALILGSPDFMRR
jgi:uncharacterized protein (DUF1800 family)